MNWKIEEIQELNGYVIEWAEPGNYYISRRNRIFRSASLNQPFELIAEFDAPTWRRIASVSRLAQRLLRFSVTNIIQLANGDLFIAFDRSVGIVSNGKFSPLVGLMRPCRILRSAIAVDQNNCLFFGEYLSNDDRGAMCVYRYVPGERSVEIAYTFPPNTIRHVHGIYFDPFDESLACLTGDASRECKIIRTHDQFRSFETIGEGDESWRAVSMLFSKDSIYYGTDAEFRSNNIYRLSRATGEREILGEVTGTVFYSQQFMGEMFIATTAENAPSQKENKAVIWNIDCAGNLVEIAKFDKDRWHPTFFGFGTVYFPYMASTSKRLFFHLSATRNDNRTFEIVPIN